MISYQFLNHKIFATSIEAPQLMAMTIELTSFLNGDTSGSRANIWLSDIKYFKDMNLVWDAWVSPGNTPARACVEAKLARDDLLVEIMVTAAL